MSNNHPNRMSMWYLDLPKGEQYFNWNELFYYVLLGEQDRKRQEYRIDSLVLSGLVQLRCVSGIQHLITFGNFLPRIQFSLDLWWIFWELSASCETILLRSECPTVFVTKCLAIFHTVTSQGSHEITTRKKFVLFNGFWSRVILEFSVLAP